MRFRKTIVFLLCVLLLTGCAAVRDLSVGKQTEQEPGDVGFETFAWAMTEAEVKEAAGGLRLIAEDSGMITYAYDDETHPFVNLRKRIAEELGAEQIEGAVEVHLLMEEGLLCRVSVYVEYRDVIPWQPWEDALVEMDVILAEAFTKLTFNDEKPKKVYGYESETSKVVLMLYYDLDAGVNRLVVDYTPAYPIKN